MQNTSAKIPQNLESARILVVDDEVTQLNALCTTLQERGLAVVGFSDPAAALAAEKQSPYDLLLCDLMMPKMNGIELLQAASLIDPNLVSIIMTGEGTIRTAVEAMKAGALDYILKPFSLSTALPVFSRALSVRRLRLENASLQQHLKERNAVLEATNLELDNFASTVAHDLRAPARHIAAYAQTLEEENRTNLSGSSRENLARIIEASNRLNQLILDLLRFARTAHQVFRAEMIDLNRLVGDVRQALEPEVKGRTIRWIMAELPTVPADPSLLHQVYYNLLSNAIKYTSRRADAEIEIGRVADPVEEPAFFVKDNGVGFDMTYVEKLFGVFQRLHSASEFEGSGIGLANVRRIISRHGGRTWAKGEVNKGACFYFTLPSLG